MSSDTWNTVQSLQIEEENEKGLKLKFLANEIPREMPHQLENAQKRPALREQELKMQYLLIVFTDPNGRFLHGATSQAISKSKDRDARISRKGRIYAQGREEREMAIWKIIREEI